MVDLATGSVGADELRGLLGLLDVSAPQIIGFDTEAKPAALFAGHARNRTALIQLASMYACVLFRTVGVSSLPDSLLNVLADPSVVKVGQGVGGDLKVLKEDFPSSPSAPPSLRAPNSKFANFVDLHRIACKFNFQPKSLQGLTGLFLKRRLLKDMRVSNWETDVLRAEQIQYAAIDAWAARAVYVEMLTRNEQLGDVHKIGLLTDSDLSSPTLVDHVHASPPDLVDDEVPPSPSGVSGLVQLCVREGHVLRLGGFEKDSGNRFRCVFEITLAGTRKVMKFGSVSSHSSMRDAQTDAASVALLAHPFFTN